MSSSFADATSDILVLGATGFTGRLITRYLTSHRQKSLFRLALGCAKLVEDEKVAEKVDELVTVDVSNFESLERAVKKTRIIINTVGPFWLYGTPVVAACVRNNVHYVDLTGESTWIKRIIAEYDFAATKNHTIIVPSCGYDSVPSDIAAWLANKTLKAYAAVHRPDEPFIGIKSSISAHKVRGGISGGTFASVLATFNDTPTKVLRETSVPYSLSPGTQSPKLLYDLVVPSVRHIVGGFWMMRQTNAWLVQRTFGLYEALGQEDIRSMVDKMRYGPQFMYDEFMETPSKMSALITSIFLVSSFFLLQFCKPFRWLAAKVVPKSGDGPSDEEMEKGSITLTNVTTSDSTPPIKVQTTITGKGDPGYLLTAVMISECALSLLFWQPSRPNTPTTELKDVMRWTNFAREGGVLTPMTAFGEEIITRLCETRKFTFSSFIVEENKGGEGKKDI
ncbi:Saccharopine dehydrogenase-domain-containing protein [Ephemerocybe angulata]|uniref:Saccharopine dehydrogenase-domain-containing protein n=1 Tax=Ephemerocybe angulata TaxID=980116 RepID=A0A8H6I9E6_9AGAR|nr:Saccharopine dehydrogenase-domain-containing protein [Tulosesus angulatus]